ncbi:MAG: CBS domain-containing protein [Nitrospirae bacterium]|nr:CBS domain-containing protein [Nitrospirota bacterium]
MVPVRKIMTKGIEKVDANMSVKDVARIMKAKKIGSILVEKDKELVGIITETDIVRRLVADGKNPEGMQVKAIMSSPILTVDIEKSIIDANDLMDKNHVRHLAVTEEGRVIGLVSCRDIMHPLYMEGEEW